MGSFIQYAAGVKWNDGRHCGVASGVVDGGDGGDGGLGDGGSFDGGGDGGLDARQVLRRHIPRPSDQRTQAGDREEDLGDHVGVGIAGMMATMIEAEKFGLSVDVVDDLTGKKLGRASSGTFRTADVVGLDTMAHVIKTLQDNLKDDPFFPSYGTPPVLAKLIEQGALGQKSGAGFYRKVGKDVLRLDPAKADYVPGGAKADPLIDRILKKPAAERLKLLHDSSNPQAQFLWAILRDAFHYAAVHLEDIAETARDVDFAMRWGFGSQQGPFELWQAAGWTQVAQWIAEDIAAGKTMSDAPLPAWVLARGDAGVHAASGSYAPSIDGLRPRSALPVYQRQYFPDAIYTESFDQGTTIFETDGVRLWHQGDDIAILSFKSKMNTIGASVLAGVNRASDEAEKGYKALVIWQTSEPFSAGADLKDALPVVAAGKWDEFEQIVASFQAASQRIKYSLVPVVSAVRGAAVGARYGIGPVIEHVVDEGLGLAEEGLEPHRIERPVDVVDRRLFPHRLPFAVFSKLHLAIGVDIDGARLPDHDIAMLRIWQARRRHLVAHPVLGCDATRELDLAHGVEAGIGHVPEGLDRGEDALRLGAQHEAHQVVEMDARIEKGAALLGFAGPGALVDNIVGEQRTSLEHADAADRAVGRRCVFGEEARKRACGRLIDRFLVSNQLAERVVDQVCHFLTEFCLEVAGGQLEADQAALRQGGGGVVQELAVPAAVVEDGAAGAQVGQQVAQAQLVAHAAQQAAAGLAVVAGRVGAQELALVRHGALAGAAAGAAVGVAGVARQAVFMVGDGVLRGGPLRLAAAGGAGRPQPGVQRDRKSVV